MPRVRGFIRLVLEALHSAVSCLYTEMTAVDVTTNKAFVKHSRLMSCPGFLDVQHPPTGWAFLSSAELSARVAAARMRAVSGSSTVLCGARFRAMV